jgi:hypothetical protein
MMEETPRTLKMPTPFSKRVEEEVQKWLEKEPYNSFWQAERAWKNGAHVGAAIILKHLIENPNLNPETLLREVLNDE